MGNLNVALEDLKKAADLEPDDPNIQFALGFLHLNIREPQNAISSFNSAINIDSTYWNAYFNRGLVFMEELDFEQQKEFLQKIKTMTDKDYKKFRRKYHKIHNSNLHIKSSLWTGTTRT